MKFSRKYYCPVFIAYFSFVEGQGGFATLSFIPSKDTLSYDG